LKPDKPEDGFFKVSRKPGIKICPRCLSMDVDATTGTGFVSTPLYVCNRCGFTGAIFPELEREEALRYARSAASGTEEGAIGGETENAKADEEDEGPERG